MGPQGHRRGTRYAFRLSSCPGADGEPASSVDTSAGAEEPAEDKWLRDYDARKAAERRGK
jgi:hypothetical protein